MIDPSTWLGIAVLLLGSFCTAANSVLWTAKLPPCSSCERLLCIGTFALAQVVVVVATLGLVGALHFGTVLIVFLAVTSISVARKGWRTAWRELAAASGLWRREGAQAISLLRCSSTWPAAFGVLVALIVLGAVSLAQPPIAYDDLLYHLPYPVEWLQSGRLDNPYQPWGAQASPYYGLNFELVYFWLLAPLHADTLAKVAQLPALGLLSIAIYAAGRECGARRGDSLLAAFLPWSNPSLVTQAFFNANGDLWASSMLATAVALALLVWRRGPAFLVPASLAVGLFLGSRSYSPLFAPYPFALLVLAVVLSRAGSRREGARSAVSALARDLVAVFALVTLSGGFWYLRNLVLFGNPIHPYLAVTGQGISLQVQGVPFRYDLPQFLVALQEQGVAMPIVLLGFVLAALILILSKRRGKGVILSCPRRRRRQTSGMTFSGARRPDVIESEEGVILSEAKDLLAPGARASCPRGRDARAPGMAVLLAPLAIFGLFYLVPSPLREARLLLPAVAAAYLAVPLVLSDVAAAYRRGKPPLLQGSDSRCLVGPRTALAASVVLGAYPTYAALKQLAGSDITVQSALPGATLVVAAMVSLALLFVFPSRMGSHVRIGLGGILAAVAISALANVADESRLHRYEVWQRLWPEMPDGLGGDLGKGWAWIEERTAGGGSTIAYVGSNLPYPLYGSRYQNRVVAVPLDGDLSETHYGFGRDLKPVPQNPDFDRWRRALADLGAEYLFVTHFPSPEGRVLEEVWVQSDPAEFPAVYTSRQATVYRVLVGK